MYTGRLPEQMVEFRGVCRMLMIDTHLIFMYASSLGAGEHRHNGGLPEWAER